MLRIRNIFYLSVILAMMCLTTKGQTSVASQYNSAVIGMSAGLPGNYIDDMLADSNGFVWVATYGSGLVRYDGYSCMPLPSINAADRLGSYSCKTICEDRHKRIWVAFDEGVRVIDMNTLQPVTPTYKGKSISYILDEPAIRTTTDANGDVWIASNTKIFYLKIAKDGNVSNIAKMPYKNSMPSLCLADVENNGTMWTSLQGRIIKMRPEGNVIVSTEVSVSLREIATRFVTDMKIFAGSLWITTNDGLYRCYSWKASEGRTPSAFRPRRSARGVMERL